MNIEKSELDPKEVFDFVGYQYDLKEGKVRPTLECWQPLTAKIQDLMFGNTCPVWQLKSLIRLPTAIEKQVHLGGLHMRPRVPLEKQLEGTGDPRKSKPCTKVISPSLKMVTSVRKCTSRSTITTPQQCTANLYKCIKRRVGCFS